VVAPGWAVAVAAGSGTVLPAGTVVLAGGPLRIAAAISAREAPGLADGVAGVVGGGAGGMVEAAAGGGAGDMVEVAAGGGAGDMVEAAAGGGAAAGEGVTDCAGAAGAAGGMGRRVEDAVSGETNKVSLYSSSTMKSCNWMLLRLIICARIYFEGTRLCLIQGLVSN